RPASSCAEAPENAPSAATASSTAVRVVKGRIPACIAPSRRRRSRQSSSILPDTVSPLPERPLNVAGESSGRPPRRRLGACPRPASVGGLAVVVAWAAARRRPDMISLVGNQLLRLATARRAAARRNPPAGGGVQAC